MLKLPMGRVGLELFIELVLGHPVELVFLKIYLRSRHQRVRSLFQQGAASLHEAGGAGSLVD